MSVNQNLIDQLTKVQDDLFDELKELNFESESASRHRNFEDYQRSTYDPELTMTVKEWHAGERYNKITDVAKQQVELMGEIANKNLTDTKNISRTKSPDGTVSETEHEKNHQEYRKMLETLINANKVETTELMDKIPEIEKGIAEGGKIEIEAIIDGFKKQSDMIRNDSSIENRRDRILKQIMEIEQMKEKLRRGQVLEVEQATQGVRMSEIDAETQAIRTEVTQEKDNSIEERE